MGALAQVGSRQLTLSDLTGRQKVAVLLMALGPEAAASLTRDFTPEELEAVSLEIARLENVPRDVAQAVLNEWQETELAAYSVAEGGVDYARRILEDALGSQRAAAALKRIEGQLHESTGFRTLRRADPQQLSSVLRNEHAQTIALILAHLDPGQTAAALKELPPALGSDVLLRMARMEKVLPEVVQVVEKSFGGDTALSLSGDMSFAGGPATVAAVLNLVTGTMEKELLDGIGKRDQVLCDEIKDLMFVFDDIAKLDDKSLQRVLREVDSKELALALKAASEELRQRILSTMSQRAVSALKEEMEFLGPVRVRDVESAQVNIVKIVRGLEEAGEIVIGGGSDEMVIE